MTLIGFYCSSSDLFSDDTLFSADLVTDSFRGDLEREALHSLFICPGLPHLKHFPLQSSSLQSVALSKNYQCPGL